MTLFPHSPKLPNPPGASHHVERRAQDRLADQPYAKLREVSCCYDNGVLTLVGRLPSFYLKQLAQEAVGGLDGIRQVVNRIEVPAWN